MRYLARVHSVRAHRNICHLELRFYNIPEPCFSRDILSTCFTTLCVGLLQPMILMESNSKRGLGDLNGMEESQGEPACSEKGSKEEEARRPVAQWTAAEVCAWLRGKTLGAPSSPLLEAANSHAISGKALLRLSEETLERMGIMPKSLREDLLQEILLLRIQQEMEDLLDISDE
ncbi:sterile alpha motif domain-containing protein 12-like isoform X2 [Candoia aspera]|uniref:sterile alpha motif domain-containing protein 12-like isoform X2 n=1 Tax=Candoia aspera TaxID=51853 RepID=UPI002FD7C15E